MTHIAHKASLLPLLSSILSFLLLSPSESKVTPPPQKQGSLHVLSCLKRFPWPLFSKTATSVLLSLLLQHQREASVSYLCHLQHQWMTEMRSLKGCVDCVGGAVGDTLMCWVSQQQMLEAIVAAHRKLTCFISSFAKLPIRLKYFIKYRCQNSVPDRFIPL